MKTENFFNTVEPVDAKHSYVWFKAAPIEHFPENAGACVKSNGMQIAVFNFSRRNEWFACQNLCPHKKQMILSRGMIGSAGDEPKVACPFHKRTFSLRNGQCLNESQEENISVFPVKVQDGFVYVGFPT
jgi:nitrite reductase (NADH) small subunit